MALTQIHTDFSLAGKSIFAGSVISKTESGFRILTHEGQFIEAQLAASCLVEPQKTSEVLLTSTAKEIYILAVLTHPSKTLRLEAKNIEISSEQLLLQNKSTEIQTHQLRFDARRIFSFAKRMYSEIGQLFQKTDSAYLESRHYKITTESLSEDVKSLRFSKASVMSEKAGIVSTQADKVLIN